MKVAYITAGAAGMYCGSCLHDNTLAAALIRKGHDVSLIPTYTPVRTDETDVSIDRVFYGAINVYLEQKAALFRHTPWLVDRMLDSPRLLSWATNRAGPTDARNLGALTLSVLQGEDGNQSKELEKLVVWLRDELRPDVVNLTNSMFLGMARRIRRELGVPILCSLQGEDIFLDDLVEPYASRVRQALIERARDVDGFIATSRYYVDHMSELMQTPKERIHHVRLGLKLDDFRGREPAAGEAGRPFTIGYLARICPEKGLHLLVEGFRRLVEQVGRERVRLEIAGYLAQRDRDYCDGILQQMKQQGLDGIVDYRGEVDRRGKIEFLESLDVLSVPTTYAEPKGLFVLEALASGVPVVQPRHGAFPEMLEATGGGLLVEPDSPPALAEALRGLMDDPARRAELGRKGREAVHRDYSDDVMAEATLAIYRRYVAASGQ